MESDVTPDDTDGTIEGEARDRHSAKLAPHLSHPGVDWAWSEMDDHKKPVDRPADHEEWI